MFFAFYYSKLYKIRQRSKQGDWKKMADEITEIKEIAEKYLEDLKGIKEVRIIFTRRMNGQWKVVVKYDTPDNPDTMSMLIINWETKKVDMFREGILTY